MKMTVRYLCALILLAGVSSSAACTPHRPGDGGSASARPAAKPEAPRLVVLVIIDMFRADYLERFADRFGPGGFRRLLEEGAHCTRCIYPYALTETAAGNATLATGTTPDRHGIISNGWYGAAPGIYSGAVDDPAHPLVGGSSDLSGASPRHLLSETLGDLMRRLSDGRSRVYGVSGKDRAAIFSSGRSASGAYWLDRTTGRFMSSTYYGDRLPGWVEAFNDRLPIGRFAGRTWNVPGGEPVTLPSKVDAEGLFFYRFALTPDLDRHIAAFAKEMIVRERLGDDGDVDLIAIGLSGHDWLGHAVGPYDPSIAALAVQTDALLADLLRFLDDQVGPDGYLLAISSDHGVVPTVDQARELGLPGRVLDQEALREALQGALAARFGDDEWIVPAGHWTRLRINRAALARHGVGLTEVARAAGEAALAVDGILGYWTDGATSFDAALATAVRLSTYPGRSPDLLLIGEAYTLFTSGDRAGHGTPHPYDTHVPLLLFGPPFRPGAVADECSPLDLAPTLARALGVAPPEDAGGRPLLETLIETDPGAATHITEEQ